MQNIRFIGWVVGVLAGCVSTRASDHAAPLAAQTSERTAALVRMVIAREVAPTSPIRLSNRYLCVDALGRECLETASDTVTSAVRRAVRQQVLRCAQSASVAATLVQFSRARIRGDSIELYVSLTSGAYGQPGDQATYRVRGAMNPSAEHSTVPEIVGVYHAQIMRGQPRSGVQPDDTCNGRDDAAEP